MVRWSGLLTLFCLMAPSLAAQQLGPDSPFEVVFARFIDAPVHMDDGRVKDQKGVRFVIRSPWTHSEAERSAFVDLIIADPSRFTSDRAILKVMTEVDLLLLVADFYRNSDSQVIQTILYFKDMRRSGWERLVPQEKGN
jgi:hypothetical protein